jgi:hypothetical protein
MPFERKWSPPGALNDVELAEALSLVLRDLEINKMLDELFENTRDIRLGKAERDRDLPDRLGVRTYQLIVSAFSNATLLDGYEISRHLFDEVARRLTPTSSSAIGS